MTFRRRSFLAGATAVLGAIVCFMVAHAVGQELTVEGRGAGTTEVPVGAVAFATLVAVAAAVGVAVVARRTRRPRVVFLTAAVLGGVVTTIPPITAATNTATAMWLLAMHAIVAASIVPTLALSLSVRRKDDPPAPTSTGTGR